MNALRRLFWGLRAEYLRHILDRMDPRHPDYLPTLDEYRYASSRLSFLNRLKRISL